MNKVYKLIWSKVRNCWVAVAEIAKSHSKDKKNVIFGTVKGVRVALSATMLCASIMAPFMAKPVDAASVVNSLPNGGSSGMIVDDFSSNNANLRNLALDTAWPGWSNSSFHFTYSIAGYYVYTDGNGNSTLYALANNRYIEDEALTDHIKYVKVTPSDLQSVNITLPGGSQQMSPEDIVSAIEGKNIKSKSVATSGDVTVGGNLHVKGTSQLDKAVTVGTTGANANLTVHGNEVVDGSIKAATANITGNETVGGNLTVSGKITSGNGVAAGGKVTGVTAGTADTDAVNVKQLNDGLAKKANADASNVTDAQKWADAIGKGAVTATDTRLITGKTVFDYLNNPDTELSVKKVETDELKTQNGEIKNLTAEQLEVTNLTAEDIDTQILKAVEGEITNLTTRDIETRNLKATEKITTKDIDATGTTTLNKLVVNGSTQVKNITADGDMTVTGNGEIQKNLTVGEDFFVEGKSEFKGEVVFDDNATVKGDTTLEGDLKVLGETTLKDTKVEGNLDVSGDENVGGNQTVTGKSTVGSQEVLGNSQIDGNQDIKGNLNVDGASNLNGKVTTGDDLEVGKDLKVKGNATIDGDTVMKGNADVKGDLTVEGDTELKNTLIDGTLKVTGEAEFDDKVTAKSLEVLTDATIDGSAEIKENLTVDGKTTLKGDAVAEKDLTVNGTFTANGPAEFNDTANFNKELNAVLANIDQLNAKKADIEELHVSGASQLDGDVNIGKEGAPANLTVNGNGDFAENLHVGGETLLDGKVTMGSDASVAGDFTVDGTSNLKDTNVDGKLTVTGDTEIGQNLHVKGESQLDGNTTIGTEEAPADLNVTGNATIGKDLAVAGNSDLKGDVNIGGDLHADNGTSYFDKSIWHEGEEHQVEINETGIRVGLNSTHMDAHGIYAGGHNWDEAKAAMHEDGRVKGIYGNFEKDVEVGGKLTAGEFEVKGDANVGGNLTVAGDTNVKGNAKVEKNFIVGGDTTINKNLTVNGPTNLKGDVAMDSNASVGGDLAVKGNTNIGGDVFIGGNTVVDGTVTAKDVMLPGGSLNSQLNEMDTRVSKVGANAAALAGLHPLDFDPHDKWNVAVGVGNYKDQTSVAAGLFYRPNENVMMNIGGTFGNSENMVNGGLSFSLTGKHQGVMSRAKLEKTVKDQQNVINTMARQMANMDSALKQLMDKNTLMTNMTKEFPDVAGDHWAHQAVTTLHGNGILQGYPDGEFKGNKSMTRYEYAEMLFNAMIKGNNMDPKMVREYRPELEKVARKANRPEVLKKYITTSTPASDKAMQEAGQRYNKAVG